MQSTRCSLFVCLSLSPGVLVLQKITVTNRAAFLNRQYFAHNLYDRMDTHPYLTRIEKKWSVIASVPGISRCVSYLLSLPCS